MSDAAREAAEEIANRVISQIALTHAEYREAKAKWMPKMAEVIDEHFADLLRSHDRLVEFVKWLNETIEFIDVEERTWTEQKAVELSRAALAEAEKLHG